MMPIKLYNSSRTGAVRYWKVSIDKCILTFEYGQENTINPIVSTWKGSYKNKGKANEVTPEEDALKEMNRIVLGKERKGYSLTHPSLVKNVDVMDCPEKLRFYKPLAKITKQAEDLILNGNPIITRKYDGEMMVIKVDNGEVQIFSRTMLPTHHLEDTPWAVRFPQLVKAFSKVRGSHIFTGEVVSSCKTGAKDERWLVAAVLKSKTPKALAEQVEHGTLDYIIWDWPVKDGQKNTDTYGERITSIYALTNPQGDLGQQTCVAPPAVYHNGKSSGLKPKSVEKFLDTYKKFSETLSYEGFILADGDDNYSDKLYNFRGKTDRPKTFCKIKPIYEDDFVAFWDPEEGEGAYGKGRHDGLLGSVAIYQYDRNGDLVYICDCGGGFDDDIRKEARKEDFPMVMQIKYDSRTYKSSGADTNALQFPRMMMVRTDKLIEECINEQL
jgi:ATP-dependent DNA ligase